MTVSTPVIVAITILSCCLVITSALLVYKLRPDIPQQPRKWSGITSEPPSPVRKMTVVRGVVVEDEVAKPRPSLLPRWSTLYTSRRTSVVSSLRGRASFIVNSQVDLEAQLKRDYEKFPEVNIEEYLGFEKSRRARRFGGSRASSIRIPQPLTIHRDSFSSDELRISPDALSPKSPPASAPAALSREDSMTISRKAVPIADDTDPIRRHSIPTNMPLQAPQTRGPFSISFLKAASISALPPSAFSARATPEPSLRSPVSVTPEPHKRQSIELKLLSGLETVKKDEEEPRLSRQRSRDLETITESSPGTEAAAPSPVIPLKRSVSKPRSRSRSIPRKIREGSLLQRLGRNRPPPIRLSAINMRDPPVAIKRQSIQQGTWSTPESELDEPILTSSGPITPPVMSSNIISIVPSYPAFVPSSIRQSTATIASSQYSPTFSLASAQRVPLFAGKLKPLVAHSMRPDLPPLPPLPDMTQSVPTTPRKIATGLRKPIKPTNPLEVSSFPRPPSSLRNSPLSATFNSQLPPVTKKVHIISPLVDGDYHSTPSAKILHTPTIGLPQERSRRPSRYSHLIDKDLPPPPPATSTTVEALLEAQQSQPPEPVPKSPQYPQSRLQPALIKPSISPSQPQPPATPKSPPSTLPSTSQQHPKTQDPKPLIPHIRSQSLTSKAAPANPETQPSVLSATHYIYDEQQPLPPLPSMPPATEATTATDAAATESTAAPPLLPTSRAVSPLTTTPDNLLSRANSASRATSHHRRGRTTNATVSPLSEQFPTELKLNLDLAVGSELGLDFGRDKFQK